MTTKTPRARLTVQTNGGKLKDTKKARLIQLLSAKAGADVAEISGRLDWQPHTNRAAITGLKKAGYEVMTEKPDPDKPTRYRITGKPEPESVTSSAPEPAHAG
ncbi:DUF3489 domain-containing protein [Ostreiculturibacter nitratireducens]|uniref:DUF3489 domain-containing protein n=1 Tax=Ostreiculturibacter nitratireducens TaxID=3075226 RepID=UPI0031B5792F